MGAQKSRVVAGLVVILGFCVVELCIADPPSPTGRFLLTDAADYPSFVGFLSMLKYLVGIGFTAIAGLVIYTHNVQMSTLEKVCEVKHKAVDAEFDDAWTEINKCCPRSKEKK